MKTLKVVKIGSEIIDNNKRLLQFLNDFSNLDGPKVLVHGGGKRATQLAESLQLPVRLVEGRRITDAKTLEVATMVYSGQVNTSIVAKLQQNHCNAIGLSGADANVISAVKRPVVSVDYGFVGDIETVDNSFISLLLNKQLTPVFCAITHDQKGQLLNTNADTIASAIAVALSKQFNTELFYCFDKPGVLKDIEDNSSVLLKIDPQTYRDLKTKGFINEGMIPKLDNSFSAIANGVHKVCIGNTNLLKPNHELFTTISA